jgi:hypothetical protein
MRTAQVDRHWRYAMRALLRVTLVGLVFAASAGLAQATPIKF